MKQITKLYVAGVQVSDKINNDLKDNTDWEIFKVIPTFMSPDQNIHAVLVVFNVIPMKKRIIEDYNPFEAPGAHSTYLRNVGPNKYEEDV